MKIPDIAEQQLIKLFDKKFDGDIKSRYDKFMKECFDLNISITAYYDNKSPKQLEILLERLSYVQGTFTHLASTMGLYQREMLHNCIDNIISKKK